MSTLTVLRAGPGTSLQDGGRFGWRRQGVAVSGAMDRLALAVANALVGNPLQTAAIETTLAGATFCAGDAPVLVAAGGPGVVLSVAGRALPPGRSALAAPGDSIGLSAPISGMHGYLAVAGGFGLSPEMGSLSTHLRSGLGPAPLAAGSRLPVCGGGMTPLWLPRVPGHGAGPIRAMPGPQDDWFADEALDLLCSTDWQFDLRSDRMGRYLCGPALPPRPGSMVSDGVLPGSIQVPPSGQPVVLMRDCQTTGGYPKIATVISADLDRLAQIPAGVPFRVTAVTREVAVAAAAALARSLRDIVPRPAGGTDPARLWSENLVGGVWNARDDDATDEGATEGGNAGG
ncbi:MAG: biotin-dependent carboxyltransferase family protein [Rhodobacteraceae bacterium]|jgi:biotin-dependent carboxylase-like uncharacterized protein|nr:biotin-dependent carboxyltransferase family protein [Paracoccaceae bacterium]